MKKIFMFLILGIFLISLASASVNYEEENQTYKIDTIWPSWLGGDGQSLVKLVNNTEECLIDCSFTLEFNNEQPVSLLEDINFLNKKGEDVQSTLKNLDFKIGKYENITTTTPIYNTTCEDIFNETTNNFTQSCTQTQTGEDTSTEEVLTWNDYSGEAVNGLSYLKVNAKKDPKKSMDWIITFRGEDLVNWAWWNTSWEYKREITITENSGSSLSDYSVLINVPYSANMNTDFSDLRFLDYTESTELGYYIENKTDSSEAWLWVKIPSLTASSNTSIYMYYGNSGASSDSNGDNVFYLFDNFNDNSINTSKWDSCTSIGNPTETGGELVFSVSNSMCLRIDSTKNFDLHSGSIGWEFDFDVKPTGYGVASNGQSYMRIEPSSGGESNTLIADYGSYTSNGYDNGFNVDNGNAGNIDLTYNTWTEYNTKYYNGNKSVTTTTLNILTDTFGSNPTTTARFQFGRDIANNGVHFNVDNFYIRRMANTEPTYSIGAEEQNAGVSIEFVTPPTPVNYFNSTNETITVEVNITLNQANFTNITYYMQNINGTSFTNTFTNETYSLNYSLPTAHYHYNVTACGDSDTLGTFCASTETRHINHDVTPPEINLTSPTGTYDYLIENYSLDLDYNITDVGINDSLNSCWFIYNNITTSINCSLNTTQFNYSTDINNLTIYANDTFGNTQSEFTEWTYKLLEVNQTYNAEVTEGSLETFLAHTKLGSGLSISDAVLFTYNGSQTTGQAFTLGDYDILRKADYLIPSISADTNITFHWSLTLSDTTAINLSEQNQTIYNLAIDNCGSYTKELYNFTVLDEETQTFLPNATIEIAVDLYDSSRTSKVFNYSNLFESTNPVRICLNRNITEGSSYSLDSIIRYEDSDAANEYYNIVDSTLDNDTTSQKITLYDLNLTDSTEFQLTFTGSDFLPVEDALVYVDRQYISENTFKTVELPKTDYNGQTVLHLVRNDVIYNIRVIKDGEVLGNFETLTAFCDDFTIGDCNIELNAFDSVESIFNYDGSLGIIFTSPSYNESSNKITFNFVTEDGESKTVKLNVSRNDIFGNRSICSTSITSSGGTLTCNIDPNLDETTLKTEVYVDNVLAISGNVKLDDSGYGVGGYLIFVVFIISFALMFAASGERRSSKTMVLISVILSFAGGIGLSLISGDIIGIGASGLWLLVIVIIGIVKLNKERRQ